jgi:SNF2 family DNA or RNA helicase
VKTYGTVQLTKEGWLIECEPQVMMRLKRVFARVDKGSRGRAVLSDTAEHGYELRWFSDRYPMQFDAVCFSHLTSRAKEYEQRQAAIQEALAIDFTPSQIALAKPLREYQKVAAELAKRTRGLLIADDVGLGKSCEAIGLIADPEARPALVVTLTHLPLQWAKEVQKFLPGARTHILKRGTPYPLPIPPPDVIITNYAKLHGWAETLAGHVRTVIYDEAQELRTGPGERDKKSLKYGAAAHIAGAAEWRCGLTATPIYNFGDEMYHVLDVLAPGELGTRAEFGREWCSGSMYKGARITAPRTFGRYLRDQGLMIRRTRRDVGRELPPVSKIVQPVSADLKALDAIRPSATELAKIILSASGGARFEKLQASQEFSYKLRQATGVAKAAHVAAFVRILIEGGERVVLYGWHHVVYKLWKELFSDLTDARGVPTPPEFYTGQESLPQKEEARRRFVEGETPLLIMSLRAGAGLEGLQEAARTVVFGELDWSPGVHEQAVGRVHRDGQDEPVMAYFMTADVGADPVMIDVLGLKREQSEGVRDPDGELFEDLQVDENHVKRLAEAYLRRQGLSGG